MTPADLRALAKRVCEEQPSASSSLSLARMHTDIEEAVTGCRLSAVAWWRRKVPPYTTCLDAAASLMPEGWRVHLVTALPAWPMWRCALRRERDARIEACDAPTEPQARAAAALLARAVEMEAGA